MTGATGVHLLLWSEDRQDWLLPAPAAMPAPSRSAAPATRHAVPMSVLRYVQRTGEPLVVADATRDDRFARDPYFADADCCSLLAVPILSRGTLRAVLLLENRLIRGAFTTDRLDAVTAHRRPARRLPRQRPAVRRAHHLPGADRRHRRPDPPADRAGPARRRPAAAGLPRPAAARGAGGGAARARRARRELDRARRRGDRRAGGAARDRPRHPPGGPGQGRPAPRPARRSPAAPRSRSTSRCMRRRAAARAGRGQRVLRRRRGTDQRGQARPRLGHHRHRRGRPATSCASRSATTAPAAPTSPAAPAWSASRTAWRHSAAGSSSTARAEPGPPCAPSSRSPRPAASRPASRRPETRRPEPEPDARRGDTAGPALVVGIDPSVLGPAAAARAPGIADGLRGASGSGG